MAYNKHWNRWIQASIAYYLKQLATTNSLAVIVEGLDARDATFMESEDRVEIKVTGPASKEHSKGEWRFDVNVNLLFSSRLGDASKNRNTIHSNCGLFHQTLEGCIPVYKYGNGPDDDGSLIGHFRPVAEDDDSVSSNFFGQVSGTDQLVQAGVNAHLVMYLSE